MSVNPVYYAYSGTIQGDRGVYDTEATLFQLFHNGTRSPVGTIRDHLLALDIRDTSMKVNADLNHLINDVYNGTLQNGDTLLRQGIVLSCAV